MNLEQRLVAVEAELAEIKAQQNTTEELSKIIREAAAQTIKNAQRPGGKFHRHGCKENAANILTAKCVIKAAVSYEAKRDCILDNTATLMRDSQHLSRL